MDTRIWLLAATVFLAGIDENTCIGIIFMGISGSLVLGVPAGMAINGWVGWCAVFAGIGLTRALPSMSRPYIWGWRSVRAWAGDWACAGKRQGATRRASHLRVLYTAGDLFTPSLRRTPYNEIKPYAFAAAPPGHRR